MRRLRKMPVELGTARFSNCGKKLESKDLNKKNV
jgi:hypothetical protein